MNWRKCFSKGVVERGEDYYQSGMVDDLTYETTGDFYAQVHGHNNYNVHVYFSNDQEICDFECDCPYFVEGNNCKHIAAVLLKWENENNLARRRTQRTQLRTIPELRQELAHLRQTGSRSQCPAEYWQTYELMQKMLSFLEHEIDCFLEHQQVAEAFKLTNLLWRNFCSTPVEDDWIADEFYTRLLGAWQKIYQVADADFHQTMFVWFTQQLRTTPRDAINADFALEIIIEFYRQLNEIYDQQGNKVLQRNCLMELIRMGDDVCTHFETMKTLYDPEEWAEVRHKIIRQVPTVHERSRLEELE